jgi:hypothetical protein
MISPTNDFDPNAPGGGSQAHFTFEFSDEVRHGLQFFGTAAHRRACSNWRSALLPACFGSLNHK